MANPEAGNQQKTQSHERFTGPIVPETLTPRRWCPNPGDDDDDHNNSRWLLLSLKLKNCTTDRFPTFLLLLSPQQQHTHKHTQGRTQVPYYRKSLFQKDSSQTIHKEKKNPTTH
jgi:hypothetical protein